MERSRQYIDFRERSFRLITIIFAAVTLAAALYDLLVGHWTDMATELAVSSVAALTFLLYHKTRRFEWASALLFWTVALAAYAFALSHQFDSHIVFMMLTPLIGLLILPSGHVVLHLILYQIGAALLLAYGYMHYPENTFIFSPAGLLNYLFATLYLLGFWLAYHLWIERTIRTLQQVNREKNMLLLELQHRVKNNFNLILSMIEMQWEHDPGVETGAFVASFQNRIHSIVLAHEMLYRHRNLTTLDLREYLPDLCTQLLEGYTGKQQIALVTNIHSLTVPIDTMIYFGILLNEWITNSLKHAFGSEGGEITVTLEKEEDTHYRLTYCDNGRGFEDAASISGFGSQVIGLSVQQLHGSLELSGRDGMCGTVRFDAGALS